MSTSEELYIRLFEKLRAVHKETHVKRIANWVWVTVGLILSQSVHLSQIALHIPGEAEAAGRVAKVRRWLANRFIAVPEFYQPLITEVLQGWANKHVYVILDACSVNHDALQFVRLSLSHCCRALPLSWLVVAGSGLIGLEKCNELLDAAVRLLRPMATVTFLADRGFRSKKWAQKCLALGWNYRIRIANSTWVTLANGARSKLCDLNVRPEQARYFQNVRLTDDADWQCNLAITWTRATAKQPAELCAIAMNVTAKWNTWKHYLKRMHIEESFRDDKSGSFNLQATKLTDPERLNRLLLAIAVAVLWIYEIGEHTLRTKQRKQIDPAHLRQLSVFQIGWRKLRRWISCHCSTLPPLTLRLKPLRLKPVLRNC